MAKDIYNKLLKDKHAPQGDLKSDLKTALFVVACLNSFNIQNKKATSQILRYQLQAVGYVNEKPLDIQVCQQLLDELCAEEALVRIGQEYVRKASLKTATVKVRARKEKTYTWWDGSDEDYRVVFFVEDELGNAYDLRSEQIVLPEDELTVQLCPEKKLAFVQEIVNPRRCILGTIGSARVPHLLTDDFALQPFNFIFSPGTLGEAKPGNVVIAEILKRKSDAIVVKTREVIRDLGKLNHIIVRAVLSNNIPSAWPHNMQRALSRIPDTVSKDDWAGRRDLRELPLVTIDGEDARDFDDAVYAYKQDSGFKLFVAIADVSYYVRPGTVLDKEAINRCNSVYFPNYVIPMLPEKLSNGICSLNPEVDRLCMVCELNISDKGLIEGYEFYPAVMNSHARLTYTEAWQMIEHGTTNIPEHEPVIEHVKVLHELYQAFAAARDARGGFAVESEEVHFVFNENLRVVGLTPVVRNDAHKMIEECMIAANVAAASFIAANKAQTLYRVHAKPSVEKLDKLNAALVRFGLKLPGGETPTPQDYNAFCHATEKRQDAQLLGQLLLRSMSKAEYTPENIGHFGLALEKYAHFTSPIRRYADLQLHRAIKFLLEKKQSPATRGKIGARSYNKSELLVLGKRCTEREIAADHAEFDVDNELKCLLVKDHVGEITQGTISAVTHFGVFVHLDDFLVDGLIFIGNISGNLVSLNEREQTVSTGQLTLHIGDKIQVRIAAVNVPEHKIDLFLATPREMRKLEQVQRSDIFVDKSTTPDVRSQTDPLFDSIADLLGGAIPEQKKGQGGTAAPVDKRQAQNTAILEQAAAKLASASPTPESAPVTGNAGNTPTAEGDGATAPLSKSAKRRNRRKRAAAAAAAQATLDSSTDSTAVATSADMAVNAGASADKSAPQAISTDQARRAPKATAATAQAKLKGKTLADLMAEMNATQSTEDYAATYGNPQVKDEDFASEGEQVGSVMAFSAAAQEPAFQESDSKEQPKVAKSKNRKGKKAASTIKDTALAEASAQAKEADALAPSAEQEPTLTPSSDNAKTRRKQSKRTIAQQFAPSYAKALPEDASLGDAAPVPATNVTPEPTADAYEAESTGKSRRKHKKKAQASSNGKALTLGDLIARGALRYDPSMEDTGGDSKLHLAPEKFTPISSAQATTGASGADGQVAGSGTSDFMASDARLNDFLADEDSATATVESTPERKVAPHFFGLNLKQITKALKRTKKDKDAKGKKAKDKAKKAKDKAKKKKAKHKKKEA